MLHDFDYLKIKTKLRKTTAKTKTARCEGENIFHFWRIKNEENHLKTGN